MDDPEIGDGDDAPLLPETTTASMRESLAALAMMSAPGAAPQIVRSGETSLEGLVRELLRPQLAEWLDRNLPPMVEKLVATEIARIVGKKG
jgi:cell pole-organizing protein PopZ